MNSDKVTCELIKLAFVSPSDESQLVPFGFLLCFPTTVYGCRIADIKGELNLDETFGEVVEDELSRLMEILCADDRPAMTDAQLVADATAGYSPVCLTEATELELVEDEAYKVVAQESFRLGVGFTASWKAHCLPMADILKEFAGLNDDLVRTDDRHRDALPA